jgi:tetratricopeptide (TPR) repeat protein
MAFPRLIAPHWCSMLVSLAALALLGVRTVRADSQLVQPVGLVLSAKTSQVNRRRDQTWIPLTGGELLFSGDSIATAGGGSTQVVFCPSKRAVFWNTEASVAFSRQSYKFERGKPASQAKVGTCVLPKVYADNEGPDDYGASLVNTLQGAPASGGPLASRLGALDLAQRTELEAGMQPLNAALAQNRLDVLALLARATLYQRFGLHDDARRDFEQVAQLLGSPAWVGPLRNTNTARGVIVNNAPAPTGGSTYALVIGISEFPHLGNNQLKFAAADALSFCDYLHLPRGGKLIDDLQLKRLINGDATVSAIENGLVDFLIAKAQTKDTVMLFMASHGVIEGKTNKPYLLTSESDLQKLSSTAIPMQRLLELLDSSRCHAGRVMIFLDVCHAARIGDFRSRLDDDFQSQVRSRPDIFAFAASRGDETSEEGLQYGGGHGAFSYFLLRGLNTGEANRDTHANTITLNLLIHYVTDKVFDATSTKQNPQELGLLARNIAIVADVHQKGIELLDYPTHGVLANNKSRGIDLPALPFPTVAAFRRAIAEGRILPNDPDSASDRLDDLRRQFAADRDSYLEEENRLRVALENAGERVLLEYLKGDEVPQPAVQFDRGAQLFRAAAQLTPEAHQLTAKSLFCEGRSLIGQHLYVEGMSKLEEAARLAPGEAYTWNALGIGYLQLPDYDRAVSAFQDAIRRAPFWAYPKHNLALALRERGNLAGAIEQYRAAIRLAPDYSYLRYNLGLLYQQINDKDGAAQAYRDALDKASREPARARIMIAQGLLDASQGRRDAALARLKDAEGHNPEPADLLALRYNRALILAHDTTGRVEAERLWGENIAQTPPHLPSLIALAEALDHWHETSRAIQRYGEILKLRPEYLAARLRLAQLLAASDSKQALQELRDGIDPKAPQPRLLEAIGDLERSLGDKAAAIAAYCSAYAAGTAAGMRSEIRTRMKALGTRPALGCPAARDR